MHIAWLGKKSPFCGNVTYGREVTNALLDRGYRVSFLHFAQEESESNDSGRPDCPEVLLPFLYKSQIYTIPTFKSSKILMQALTELKPDIVHASLTLSPLDFRLPEICEELNLPLVATFHPAFDSKLRNFKSSTQFLTYQQQHLLVKLGVPRRKLVVIPNGVDIDKYSPGVAKLKSQFNAKRLFVYLGRISTEKNVESLLKAWKHSDMGSDSKLLIVGDGPLTTALRPFYGEEYGIDWLGFVAEEQRRIEILQAADVFILPSLVEGLSLSLLEAMACEIACIATDAGADGEVLEDGAGVIIKTQAVTTHLKTFLPFFRDHPDITKLLGQKARQRVLERYTLSENITRLEKLYVEVLQQNKSRFFSSKL
jgi:glycosyltransferase involved in cell wall biosynthesis